LEREISNMDEGPERAADDCAVKRNEPNRIGNPCLPRETRMRETVKQVGEKLKQLTLADNGWGPGIQPGWAARA
jgi:hypothetical protein